MNKNEFIESIAPIVQKYAKMFGIAVASPIIAQACLESAYGTTDKAKYHNYFGLKYRENRLTCHSGFFTSDSTEQLPDGSIIPITDNWYSFDSMDAGVKGYFEYTSISRYDNLKGVSDPYKYLELIKSDGYATALNYVECVYNTLCSNNLQRFDNESISSKLLSNISIVESYLTENPCYKENRGLKVKGIMLHSVGCPQPKASVFVDSWNCASHSNSCVHAFIDGLTGVVSQTLPWEMRGWHCGAGVSGSGNDTHIGVEMCEPDCIKYSGGATFTCSDKNRAIEIANRTYKTAVSLFAYLCNKFSLDPLADGVLISHSEGYKRGIASNHADPEHLWSQLGLNYTMDGFRADVKAALDGVSSSSVPNTSDTVTEMYRVRKNWEDASSQLGAYEVLDNAIKACSDGYYVFDSNGNVVYSNVKVELYRVRKSWEDASSQLGAYNVLSNAIKACPAGYYVFDSAGNVVYPETKSGSNYVVVKGDTLSSIARRFNTTVEVLVKLNNISDPNIINVGQNIVLP